METKLIHEEEAQKTFALIFDTGDEVMADLTGFAKENSLDAARLTANSACSGLTLGFYNLEAKYFGDVGAAQSIFRAVMDQEKQL
ncbi:MAG: DNA-binding protein [Actinomycetota bacterium]|nr:DNA-binding protein [Actinomycetota bacterium]